jgi:Holliday junction resolvase
MSKSQRDKGHQFERDVVNVLKMHGYEASRNLTQTRDSGGDINLPRWLFECKRYAKIAVYTWLDQAIKSAKGNQRPVVVAKADRKEDKKAQAAAREAQSKLKREVSDAEADLAKLEVVLSAIDRAMFDPASAANEYKNLTMGELSQRRGKIVAAQEAAEARWVAASEALEKA